MIDSLTIHMTRASQLTGKPDADLATHLAFEQKLQLTTNQRFVFTDKHVSKVLNNIMMTNSVLSNTMIQSDHIIPPFLHSIMTKL